ncbi:2-iminobutanoate/2-iminopropanoate deaminase [Halopelagius inordinatus]|uniref:2-iminobutanoate/2-iminopropanoate deaminase n=1 Tax=Halopelagius inordinatus TaxID=553467 RepID=A0A1I2VAZ1_9EURY|nr:Rid family detoxifying hydrolase [Halopelagius inordinatus]SFG84291.1 2-iminobutanoate/2-iminopropanoate deaminase [Halopelagius inordinatus]
MTEKTAVSTDDAPRNDNPYSQGVLADGLLFVSGFGPVDPETGEEVEGDVGTQTHRVVENLAAVVAEAGGSLADVVKTTVYVADMDDYEAVNEAYADHFEETPPARVCVEAARLPDDVRVEIDAIANVEEE